MMKKITAIFILFMLSAGMSQADDKAFVNTRILSATSAANIATVAHENEIHLSLTPF